MSTKKSWPFMTEKEEQQQIDAWGFCARVITPEIQERYGLQNVDTLHSLVITSLEDSNNHEYKRQNDNEDFELQIGDVLTSLNGGEIEVSEGKSAYEIILSRISRYKKNAGPNKPIKLCLRLKRKDENTNEYKGIEVLSKFTFDDNNLPKEKVIVDKTVMVKNVLSVLVLCLFILVSSAFAANDDKYVILDVEGEGANRASAMDSAWLEGIRQAAGSFIDSKTELNDDKLTERIISYSRGLVEKYEIISVDDSKVSDGIYKLKMRMWIVKEILRDGTRHATANSAEISFSASDLKKTKEDEINAANANVLETHDIAAKTVKQKAQTATEILEAMLDRYKPEDFLSCYIPSKPEAVKGKSDVFNLNVELNFNEKLYKEAFIPDLIQVLDQIASVKKNTLLVKYKNELRNLATKEYIERNSEESSIILRANADNFGKDYSLAIYNKPENLGCRLYGFKAEELPKINEVLGGFHRRTMRVKGLLLELLDEDKEVIDTIEKKFDIAFLLTASNKKWSVQPTILITEGFIATNRNNPNSVPNNVEIISDNKETLLYLKYMDEMNWTSSKKSTLTETDPDFPFKIQPTGDFHGSWFSSHFYARSTTLKPGTIYTVIIKEKVNGVSISNGGNGFAFQIDKNTQSSNIKIIKGWREQTQFVIPIELEMPEEILPYVKKIRASLLVGN